MRFAIRGLLILTMFPFVLGSTCLGGTSSTGFPKTAAWTVRTVNTGVAFRPTFVATFDFDTDTKLDIVAAYQGDGASNPAVYIFFQTDPSTFTAVQVASTTDLTGVVALALGDLDGDSHRDIVAACNGQLIYMHSPANPRTASWPTSIIAQSSGAGITRWNDVAIGNIDGAFGLDIVACNDATGRLAWFRSPAANIADGTGWVLTDIDATTRSNAAGVVLDDVDSDGRLDVISTAPQEGTARVAWYKNPADPTVGTNWTKFTIGNLAFATRVGTADLNADGRTDVFALNGPGRQIGWYIHPADVATATNWSGFAITTYSTFTPVDVKAADFDGNNQIDLTADTQSSATLRWFTPVGVQTLQWVENNLADLSLTPGRIATGDIDGDGRPDVVAPLQGSTTAQDQIAWYENPEP
jgi:hypothetical protein